MRLRGGSFFNVQKFVYIFQLFVHNFPKKILPLKCILPLPMQGQKYMVLEVQPFEIKNFDLGHPVIWKHLVNPSIVHTSGFQSA